ncbi:MAG: EAL domain-containing protein [Burkholderiaceae bacterium]
MLGTGHPQFHAQTGLTLAGLLRLVTLALGLLGVVTFISVNSRHVSEPTVTPIAALADEGFNADQARTRLRDVPRDQTAAGDRSDRPFWLRALGLNDRAIEHNRLLIGDKTLRSLAVQLRDTDGVVVKEFFANRHTKTGRLLPFHGGFMLDLTGSRADEAIIKARSVGSTKFSISTQSSTALDATIDASHRLAAMLAGAMLALAAFTAVIASFTYSTPLAAASLWIVSLLGVTCITLGYDMMWLEYGGPPIVELRFKQTVLALFMVSSCLLYYCIFRRALAHIGAFLTIQRMTKAVSIVVPVMALLLPTSIYLPLFWSLAIVILTYHAKLTLSISRQHESVTVTTFAWSWGAISACILAEIAYAAGLVTRVPGISFEAGAIVGAFFAASAAASTYRIERIRRKHATERSRQVARQYREIYNQVPTGLLSLDSDGLITNANPMAKVMLGCVDMEGLSLAESLGSACEGLTASTLMRKSPIEVQTNNLTLSLDAIATRNGTEVTMTDVSAMAKLHETLDHQATHDYVTGALSWYGLERRFGNFENEQFVVFHLELTNLGMLTKLHGKAVSDAALEHLYERLDHESTSDRTIARVGNGDFVVLWPLDETPDPEAAAKRMSNAVSALPYQYQFVSLRFETCAGLAYTGPTVTVTEALAHAQRAAHENHTSGRNELTVFDPSGPLNKRLNEERYWDAFIQSDKRFENLELWAQPIVPLQSEHSRCNLEILLRVRDTYGEIQPPGGFLDAAYRHSLMPAVDYAIVKSALEFLSGHPDLGKEIGYVSVNLSSVSVNSAQFLSDLTILIAKHPVAAGLLCLEITESVALTDLESVRNFTSEMNALGITLALDDFGSGYTSFSYVKSLPAKILKLDGSFVSDIVTSAESRSIVTSVVALGHGLGMSCVAEWVTSAEAAQILREIGCDFGQGFHYSAAKPLSDWGVSLSLDPQRPGQKRSLSPQALTPATN